MIGQDAITFILVATLVAVLVLSRIGPLSDRTMMLAIATALEKAFSALPQHVVVPSARHDTTGSGLLVAGPAYLPLTALPAWRQLYSPLPDGNDDPQETSDCGETCVSMLVASTHGCPVEPGAIRQAVGGTGRSGLTTAADLVAMAAYYSTAAIAKSGTTAEAYAAIRLAAIAGRTSIILGNWPSVGSPHWVIVRAVSPSGVTVSDPWLGSTVSYTRHTFDDLFLGWWVEALGHLHYDMSHHPDPA